MEEQKKEFLIPKHRNVAKVELTPGLKYPILRRIRKGKNEFIVIEGGIEVPASYTWAFEISSK